MTHEEGLVWTKDFDWPTNTSTSRAMAPAIHFTHQNRVMKLVQTHSRRRWVRDPEWMCKDHTRHHFPPHGYISLTWERPVCQVRRDGGRHGPSLAPSGASWTERLWDFQQVEWQLSPSHYYWKCMLRRTPAWGGKKGEIQPVMWTNSHPTLTLTSYYLFCLTHCHKSI